MYDKIFKIVLVGDGGVGKTALVNNYVSGEFFEYYHQTIGVNFFAKEQLIKLKRAEKFGETIIKFYIWDTGGQDRFDNIRPMYYRDAMGALLVFDLCRSHSFDRISKWLDELNEKLVLEDLENFQIILVGNKVDIRDEQGCLRSEIANKLANDKGLLYIETSAKTGINVVQAFRLLGQMILLNTPELRKEFPSIKAPFTEFIDKFGSKDYSTLNNFISIISKPDYSFSSLDYITQALIIIQILERNIEFIPEQILAWKIISRLYDLSSCYAREINDIGEAHEYRFKGMETLIEQTQNDEDRYFAAMMLIQWFWENLTDLLNLEHWVSEFEKRQTLVDLCHSEGGRLFNITLQTYQALKTGDKDLLNKCGKKIKEIQEFFPKEEVIFKLAKTAIHKIQENMPIGRIVEINLNPSPLIKGSPAFLNIEVKNNTSKIQSFIIQQSSSGFESNNDMQKFKLKNMEKKGISFLLGKVRESSKQDLSIQIRLFDGNQKVLEDVYAEIPEVKLRTIVYDKVFPSIDTVEVEAESNIITLDRNATIKLRVKILNPRVMTQSVQLILDAPKFVTTHTGPFHPRRIPPSTKFDPIYETESIILGTPETPGSYSIHLKLLDIDGKVIPKSDKEITLKFKISKKKKIIKFLKGVVTAAQIAPSFS